MNFLSGKTRCGIKQHNTRKHFHDSPNLNIPACRLRGALRHSTSSSPPLCKVVKDRRSRLAQYSAPELSRKEEEEEGLAPPSSPPSSTEVTTDEDEDELFASSHSESPSFEEVGDMETCGVGGVKNEISRVVAVAMWVAFCCMAIDAFRMCLS